MNRCAVHLKLTQYCESTILQLKKRFKTSQDQQFSILLCKGKLKRTQSDCFAIRVIVINNNV